MQFDIHSPANTVYEALRYSAEMRLIDIDKKQLLQFVDQVTPTTQHWCLVYQYLS